MAWAEQIESMPLQASVQTKSQPAAKGTAQGVRCHLILEMLPVFKSNLMSTPQPFDVQANRQLFELAGATPAVSGFRKAQGSPDMRKQQVQVKYANIDSGLQKE